MAVLQLLQCDYLLKEWHVDGDDDDDNVGNDDIDVR